MSQQHKCDPVSHSLNHKGNYSPHCPLISPHPYTHMHTKMQCCTQSDIHDSLRILSVRTDRGLCVYAGLCVLSVRVSACVRVALSMYAKQEISLSPEVCSERNQ